MQRQVTELISAMKFKKILTEEGIQNFLHTWLSLPEVLLRIWTALVTLVSSDSANHTGGVEG